MFDVQRKLIVRSNEIIVC